MVGDPYDTFDDPYRYPDSDVLRNLGKIQNQNELSRFEVEMVGVRASEELPDGKFDAAHYRRIHRHLFQDVYEWAGCDRTIRSGKGGNWFCYPEYINSQMTELFGSLNGSDFKPGSDPDAFVAAAAKFLSELNAIHPFREGNGRTQLIFLRLVGIRAGHPFRSESVEPEEFMQAMIYSFAGDLEPLIDELERMQA